MKKTTIILSLLMILTVTAGFGQKNFDEIRLVNPLLESVAIEEIRDLKSYQERYFENPRAPFTKLMVKDKVPHVRDFKLIGTHDLVRVMALMNKETIDTWEDFVKMSCEAHSVNQEYTVDFMELKRGRGAILVIKDPISLMDYFYYHNPELKVSFLLIYINNSSFEIRMDNMRRILRAMEIELL